MRWISPIGMYPRRVTRDVELSGTTLPRDLQIGLCVGAANRDDSRFAEPDRFDVTRVTADKHRKARGEMYPGEPFALSWEILGPAIEHRDAVRRFLVDNQAAVVTLDHAMWRLYERAYLAEMRESYRRHRAAWEALLRREVVTLCCFCTDAARCHRTALARVLTKLGAQHHGERTA